MVKNKNKVFVISVVLISIIHVALILFYGIRKEGFHEDEYYSFWSSAGYADLMPEGHYDWRMGPEIQEQFVVTPGDEFNFNAVIQNQAEDVHPPLFYLCLNIIMSLMPGRFFKWFAIALNTVFSLITLFGVTFFFYQLSEDKEQKKFALVAAGLYGIAPSTISNVMFARMYAMSAMWNVLYACILLMAIRQLEGSRRRFGLWTLCGTAICYLSFLTHYFSLLLPGLLTVGACIYVLIRRKNIIRMLVYGISMLTGIGLAILTFPVSLKHMFSGYRGTGVLGELNLNGFAGRIRFFGSMLNEYAAGGWIAGILAILAISVIIFLVIIVLRWKHATVLEHREWYWYGMGLICCVIASLILMKISLYVYGVGCRFFFPVLAFMIPLIGCFVLKVMSMLFLQLQIKISNKWAIAVWAAVVLVMTVPYIKGHIDHKILFLYEEDAEKVVFAQEYKEYPLILLCDRDNMYRTWYTANQLWPFDRIFYTDYEHIMIESFNEPTVQSADKLVVYMDAPEEAVQKLVEINPNLHEYTLVRHDPFYYVYLLE